MCIFLKLIIKIIMKCLDFINFLAGKIWGMPEIYGFLFLLNLSLKIDKIKISKLKKYSRQRQVKVNKNI
jgi:hypothetical protein